MAGFFAIKVLFGLFVVGSMVIKGLFGLCLADFMACLWLILWDDL